MFGKLFKKLMEPETALSPITTTETKDQIELLVELLKTNPSRIKDFQKSYAQVMDEATEHNENLFEQKADSLASSKTTLTDRIVNELLSRSFIWSTDSNYQKKRVQIGTSDLINLDEFKTLPNKPQFTGLLAKYDIGSKETTEAVFYFLKKYLETNDVQFYHRFRQGLDVMDISPEIYDILSLDPNSMSNWLPQIQDINSRVGFFKIPDTKILRVPLALLQTTRTIGYTELTPESVAIINDYIYKVFDLDDTKDYFIKTGTFSSKFEFRNAQVPAGQEVKELGSYLYFIQQQANQMASSLNNIVMYGVSSNNDWVVREYIHPQPDVPTIYNGLPLRCEFRAFVDFDTKEILGMSPYWEPNVMKKNFSQKISNKKDPSAYKAMQDYVVYSAYEPTLMAQYHENKDLVLAEIQKLLDQSNHELIGQWSLDIMMNGENEFYLIDMAQAGLSALSECVPDGLIKPVMNFLPEMKEK